MNCTKTSTQKNTPRRGKDETVSWSGLEVMPVYCYILILQSACPTDHQRLPTLVIVLRAEAFLCYLDVVGQNELPLTAFRIVNSGDDLVLLLSGYQFGSCTGNIGVWQ